ncbi:branched-chain amino acid ABC transporter permease [Haloarcula japonica]|uniref:Branched-chain amino acid ABC transporter permease n=1 Tax=Haloarcula japonica (strain ATCC 49778 / DSM 6131 / JCM 7785 / NBRC 101032 / NCIMB 13157 / TR-1) TaxID=1227453 RepID=M0LN73_HALJT|nr:branched-chain amino acid ABC transporter permease [Haloarcula japonica]EMA33485.1 branched-chain amino acid ABC transporter permease [Haloarcula japonica DSM 6131]
MSIDGIVGFLFIALSVASLYLLVAVGLSIVFGSLKYVNMAHGVLYLAGAYIGLLIASSNQYGGLLGEAGQVGLGWGFIPALVLTPVVIFVLGIVMERFIAKPFYERDLLDQLLVTFGILIAAQELVAIVFGRTGTIYPRPEWLTGAISLPVIGTPPGMSAASTIRVLVVVLTLLLILAIFAFFKYSDYGLAVRAGTEDSEMAQMLGIRVGRPFLLIFAVGAAYAGLAGVLGGSLFNVTSGIGMEIIIPSLVIVIMGGVGSLRGTVIGALLAGLFFATATELVPSMTRASIYLLAIVVLTLRPNGIYPSTEIGQ